MRRFFIKIVVGALAFAGIGLYATYDRATNYETTTAKVTKVEEVCYMKKTERGVASKTTKTTKEGPCPIITAMDQTHPEFQDYDLIKVIYVEFRYRSPADGKFHRGKQRQENVRSGLPLRSGDDLQVLAHKTKPEVTSKF